jgi:sigma-54 dependent transcriptional regulator, acetoin dehydrogenase operon transcriptional activator AcoR
MAQWSDGNSARQLADRPLSDDITSGGALATEQQRGRRAELRSLARPASGGAPAGSFGAAAEGEDHVASAAERLLHERALTRHVAAIAARVSAIADLRELEASIPQLALALCSGCDAALLQVERDGVVELLSACGPSFQVPPARRGGSAATPDAVLVPLNDGDAGTLLALHPAAGSAGVTASEREHLALFASVAGAALGGARARTALREATARDAATLSTIRDGILAVDVEGRVRSANDAAAAVLGLSREQLVGRRLRELPGLGPLALAFAATPDQTPDVVTLPRGEVSFRVQRHAAGLVATLRDAATEHVTSQKIVGSVARYTFDQVVGLAPAMREVVEDAKHIARCDIPVLINGESGTGKEMLAQAIHNASPRRDAPFIAINVTAIPAELLESELFGYEGGTFTGARSGGRAGKFELAGNGTLLLDEIGDMPLELQAKLLRVLQERVVQRLGSARDVPIRARIIATTHRDLVEAVNAGRFRLDLYHRLCVLQLHIAPLRERHGDLPIIVEHQLRLHRERTGRNVRIAPEVLAALQAHDWPGNVRELLNVLEGELCLLREGADLLTRIPPMLRHLRTARHASPARAPSEAGVLSAPLSELERRACEDSLAAHGGNVGRAARALGVAKSTLYLKMKRYGLVTPAASPARAAGRRAEAEVR